MTSSSELVLIGMSDCNVVPCREATKEKVPAKPGLLGVLSALDCYFGGACGTLDPLPGQVVVPRPMPCTSMDGLPVAFTFPATATASPTWAASLEASAAGGMLSLYVVPDELVIV
jgi:hypothetical protein